MSRQADNINIIDVERCITVTINYKMERGLWSLTSHNELGIPIIPSV